MKTLQTRWIYKGFFIYNIMKTEKEIKETLKDAKQSLSFYQFIINDKKSSNDEKNVALDMINFIKIEINVLKYILR
jgi:hypothetical protein